MPVLPGAAGTFVAVAGAPASLNVGSSTLFAWRTSSTEYIEMKVASNNADFATRGGGAGTKEAYKAHASNFLRVWAATYVNGGQQDFYLDGVAGTAASPYTTFTTPPATCAIGNFGGVEYGNMPIHRLTIFADAKDAATVAGYNSLVNGVKAIGGNWKKLLVM